MRPHDHRNRTRAHRHIQHQNDYRIQLAISSTNLIIFFFVVVVSLSYSNLLPFAVSIRRRMGATTLWLIEIMSFHCLDVEQSRATANRTGYTQRARNVQFPIKVISKIVMNYRLDPAASGPHRASTYTHIRMHDVIYAPHVWPRTHLISSFANNLS